MFELIGLVLLLIFIVPASAVAIVHYNRQKVNRVCDIDGMSGHEFEDFLISVFSHFGFSAKNVGAGGGDYGGDIILENDKGRVIVQAKRYSGNVGNKAVQEVYSAIPHYNATEGWVVTNSYFTKAAITQAKSCGILLVDRKMLLGLVEQIQKQKITA